MTQPRVALRDLDLATAWRRAKWDLRNRVFVTYAFQEPIFDAAAEEWFEKLRAEDDRERYVARSCEVCDVPKAGFHIRPGARLDLDDQLVYSALVQQIYPRVRDYLTSFPRPKDYAYLLQGDSDVPWFQPAYRCWTKFRKASLDRLGAGVGVLLSADVAGYYENIDLSRLKNGLRGIGVPEELLESLFSCLYKWAEPRGRGIPQGLSASDLLAKVYLDPVDRRLGREGYDHVRYVDDIRVFCRSTLEAKRALMRLTTLLREVGLNLATKKTEIFEGQDARTSIEGRVPQILELRRGLLDVLRSSGYDNPYVTLEDLGALEEVQAAAARSVIEDAFRANFIQGSEVFDRSLFHFLLARLSKLGSELALEYCLSLLGDHPEETGALLEYVGSFLPRDDLTERVLAFATSDDALYDYQSYQIVRWLIRYRVNTEAGLQYARGFINDAGRPLWLRSQAMALVAEYGDQADLEAIEAHYSSAGSDLERGIVLCSLRRLTLPRRNALYGRSGGDGFAASLAVRWARNWAV